MRDADAARAYLRDALAKAKVTKKAASLALGKNHAYLQQYIERGRPNWLDEAEREGLAKLLPGLDPTRLRPPPKDLEPLVPAQRKQANSDTPHLHQFADEPDTLELLSVWRRITDPVRRRTAIGILEQMTDDRISAAASAAA